MSDNNNPSESEPVSNQHTSSAQDSFSPLAKRFLWADSASSVERVILGLGLLCVFLFVMDFIVHRHAYAPGEGLPGFYAIVGFVAFTIIVLGATQLRRLILRNENYYSPNSVDTEPYPESGLERLSHDSSLQASNADAQSSSKNSDQGDST